MFTLAMQVDKDKSLTSLYDLELLEKERKVGEVDNTGFYSEGLFGDGLNQTGLAPPQEPKGVELSRVSGDLVFTEDEDVDFDPEAKKAAEHLKRENVQAWIKDSSDKLNLRVFNVNEIIGNFERDWSGRIKDRDYILRKNHFRDRDGNVVNEKGYLIDSDTADIRSNTLSK